MPRLASQTDDFPQWYLDVIEQADLADYSDVKGCIIFKPYGYAIWEAMQEDLNRRIKEIDVQNAYFPLFIPESIIAKEKDHIEGFAPECAVVTHGGGKELAEKLYIRPTSETIIYATFSKWIKSHRDLPMKINQWANIVRWEMRTRPFLRTTEFLWQEGHTAHQTEEEADEMAAQALSMYADFDQEVLALPVMKGRKPDHDKFAGAEYTLTTEALARDGKAIQAGTSHMLGQGFSKAYDIKFLDNESKEQYPWITSWGVSTRLIGTMIVVHGDEKGLRLPPKIAPVQVIIIPIYKSETERETVLEKCEQLKQAWSSVRVKIDDRDDKSPGFKFNEWELKGVPIRIEIGPKDLAAESLTYVRRDTGEKVQMLSASADSLFIQSLLSEIHGSLYRQAQMYMQDHTFTVETFEDMNNYLNNVGGFVWAPWDGLKDTADRIKSVTKATIRLVDTEPHDMTGKKDLLSGNPAVKMALFAKAY
jgi:prolyl-tRNA synthetase